MSIKEYYTLISKTYECITYMGDEMKILDIELGTLSWIFWLRQK